MDIVKLADKLRDVKLGEVANGQMVIYINSLLPEDKKIYSDSTGEQLKEVYLSLPISIQKDLDKAISVEKNALLYAAILEDINYIVAQKQINKAGARETRRRYVLFFIVIFLLFNSVTVITYHNAAKNLLGEQYSSNILLMIEHSLDGVKKIFGVDITNKE